MTLVDHAFLRPVRGADLSGGSHDGGTTMDVYRYEKAECLRLGQRTLSRRVVHSDGDHLFH